MFSHEHSARGNTGIECTSLVPNYSETNNVTEHLLVLHTLKVDHGGTALIVACQNGHTQAAVELIHHGAVVDYQDKVHNNYKFLQRYYFSITTERTHISSQSIYWWSRGNCEGPVGKKGST